MHGVLPRGDSNVCWKVWLVEPNGSRWTSLHGKARRAALDADVGLAKVIVIRTSELSCIDRNCRISWVLDDRGDLINSIKKHALAHLRTLFILTNQCIRSFKIYRTFVPGRVGAVLSPPVKL